MVIRSFLSLDFTQKRSAKYKRVSQRKKNKSKRLLSDL